MGWAGLGRGRTEPEVIKQGRRSTARVPRMYMHQRITRPKSLCHRLVHDVPLWSRSDIGRSSALYVSAIHRTPLYSPNPPRSPPFLAPRPLASPSNTKGPPSSSHSRPAWTPCQRRVMAIDPPPPSDRASCPLRSVPSIGPWASTRATRRPWRRIGVWQGTTGSRRRLLSGRPGEVPVREVLERQPIAALGGWGGIGLRWTGRRGSPKTRYGDVRANEV